MFRKIKGVLRMFQWSFVLQFCSCMDLIAATRAEGGLVSLKGTVRKWGKMSLVKVIGQRVLHLLRWLNLARNIPECNQRLMACRLVVSLQNILKHLNTSLTNFFSEIFQNVKSEFIEVNQRLTASQLAVSHGFLSGIYFDKIDHLNRSRSPRSITFT